MSPMAVVAGKRGVEKTTLIRRYLESNRSRVVAASRCKAVPGSGNWSDKILPVSPSGKARIPHVDELCRYEAAGADLVSTVSYDTDQSDLACALLDAAREGGWDEWIVEADTPGHAGWHCTVFVGRPLPAGVPPRQFLHQCGDVFGPAGHQFVRDPPFQKTGLFLLVGVVSALQDLGAVLSAPPATIASCRQANDGARVRHQARPLRNPYLSIGQVALSLVGGRPRRRRMLPGQRPSIRPPSQSCRKNSSTGRTVMPWSVTR